MEITIKELAASLKASVEVMANTCSVPMDLWDRHSNLVLEAARRLEAIDPQAAWQELVDRDDRTSPAEYPDMALITRGELAEFMSLPRSTN
jgi:hypothetical protein